KIYPALFLSITYLAYLSATMGKSYQITRFRQVLVASLLIWFLSAFNYLPTISERKKELIANGYNQQHNAFGLGHIPLSGAATYVDELMKELIVKGVYNYPSESALLVNAARNSEVTSAEKMNVVVSIQ